MKRIALIPARGGSKRLLRKNILEFSGQPMLAWTVQSALDSELFDRVIVSTDDDEISTVAKSCGAEVLLRPDGISNDQATLIQVMHDTVDRASDGIDSICMLLANCPLRNAEDIANSLSDFEKRQPPALLSVTNYGWTPPFRALDLQEHRVVPIFKEWIEKKSQAYPKVACPTGAIYWTSPKAIREATDLYIDGLEGFQMPWHRSIDIDTREDFELALCMKLALDHGFCFSI
jgi:pseudaminic acid cytidylyltransferase